MKVNFRTYCGLAGDLQELLIAENEVGDKETVLISRVGCFRYYKLKRSKRKLLKKLELLTGKKHFEN